MELIIYLVTGLVAGFVGTHILKSPSNGTPNDTIVGAFGAYTATTLVKVLGLTLGGFLPLVVGFVGAIVLPLVLKAIPGSKS